MDESAPAAQWLPHYMLLYFSEPGARASIGALFPAHNAHAREFARQHPGEPFLIGPFPEPDEGQPGALAVFHDRDLAAEFAAADPFVVEGAVSEWRIREWWVSPTSAAVQRD